MMSPVITLAMNPDRTRHVLPDKLLDELARLGHLSDRAPLRAFAGDQAAAVLRETEVLVTGWGAPSIELSLLQKAPGLKLIAHCAGTVKGLVDPAVFDAGIAVTHAAEANAQPVAEFTLAAILFAGKKVFRFRDLYAAERGRSATQSLQSEPIGNYRRTVGLIGASKIGRRVIALLQPFDYEILLYDPLVKPEEAARLGVELTDLDALMAKSDIVSVHAPSLPSTRAMIDHRRLSLMRDGATLINTARGALVDETALLDHLRRGRIDAVIDVTEPEVPAPESDFYRLPNLFLTPHIAGAVGTERTRLGEMIVDEVARFVSGRPLRHQIHKHDLEHMA